MQKSSANTTQTVLGNITDNYVLSELCGVDGCNMLSGCYSLPYVWAAAKMGRITWFLCLQQHKD